MNFFGKGERETVKGARLPITAMVDVVFLLLVFFMVGSKFTELDRVTDANLRKGGPVPPPIAKRETRVAIKNEGTQTQPRLRVIIEGRSMDDWEEVYSVLRRLSRLPGVKKDPAVIAPDDDVPHGWVMKALDYLKQLGYRNIGFQR